MIEINEKSKCCGCHACFNACPVNAIEMKEDEKGFKYPKVDKEKCIKCGLCEKVCPIIQNRKVDISDEIHKAYAVNNKDDNTRKNSSSGGMFSLIATYVLENKGIVFGAAFDDEWKVKHIEIDKKEDLVKLQTSKYVQSTIGDTYKKAKQYLDDNKMVLFTGTPCQIEGLQTYLQKDYNKLYTQDIVCHGVPSPKVWKKYLEFRRKQDAAQPVRINFRQKDNGWNLFELLLQYNNSSYKTNHNDDLFFKAFLGNACLRDSCYNCSFKKMNRLSDITIGDLWGIENIAPEMNDDKGTSLVIVNSIKGKELFDKVKGNCKYQKVDLKESVDPYNPAYFRSVDKHRNADKFFDNLDNMEFDKLVNKYLQGSIFRKIVRIVKYHKI